MSFSYKVKEELEKHTSENRHCQIAELAALVHYQGMLKRSKEGKLFVEISTENPFVVRKVFTLLSKTFNITTSEYEQECHTEKKKSVYVISIEKESEIMEIFQAIKLLDGNGVLHDLRDRINPVVLKQSCCQRAFLRGAF